MSGQNNGTQVARKSPEEQRAEQFRGLVGTIVARRCADFMATAGAQERLTKTMLAEGARNPQLRECSPESIALALITCAQLRLEPSSALGLAYMVPRKNHKAGGIWEVTLQIGYKGYAELARRTGQVKTMQARVVYAADDFRVVYGLRPDLHHIPSRDAERRDEDVIGAYAVVETHDGGIYFEFIDRQEINKRRKLAGGDRFWGPHFAAMARKSAVRALFSGGLAPISAELAQAIEADNDGDVIDVDPASLVSRPTGSLASIAQNPDYDEPEIVDEPQTATRAPQRARSTDRQPAITNTSNDGMPE